jgi:aminopeptidase N
VTVRKLTTRLVLLASFAAVAAVFADDEAPFRGAPDRPLLVSKVALDLDVDLLGKSVAGTAVLDLQATRDLKTLRLDAVGLDVASVSDDARSLTFVNDGQSLTIARPLARGEAVHLKVAYAVHDPREGLHFFQPTRAEPDLPVQMWSQGESQASRAWFPCVDEPGIRMKTEITARVPEGFLALANGALASEETQGKRRVFRWVQEKPHAPYLVSLVVGKFFVGRETWRGKPVTFYVPEKNAKDVGRAFGRTRAMLDFFSERFGVEYPWDKYAQVCCEQFNGGMENTSCTTLDESPLHDERSHLDFDPEDLVAHELSHQWWGDLVTCRDWAHIWLNEGFATYCEALWDEKKNGAEGKDELEFDLYQMSARARDGVCKTRPVVDHRFLDPEGLFDDRAYPKGAWILHGLRRRLGDDAFFRSLTRYLKANAYGTVETVDLRRAFEAEAGESLERYFHDATERPAHVALDVSVSWDDAAQVLSVLVKQTQAGDPFDVSAVFAAGGSPETATRVRVQAREKETRVQIPLAAAPLYWRFDADEGVLGELVEHKSDEQWLLQLAKDPHPIGRIRAVNALAERNTPPAIEAIAKALMEDRFWGVSAEAARALGRAQGDAARDALVKALAHPRPAVRKAAVEALAGFKDEPVIGEALELLLEHGDPSYYVEAQALLATAQVESKNARLWLMKGLDRPSQDDVIRVHAIQGLAALEDPGLIPTLETAASLGPIRGRRAAVSALASLAALPGVAEADRKRVVRELVGFLDAGVLRLRGAVIEALSGLGKDSEPGLDALDRLARYDSDKDLREAAKKAAEAIRSGTTPAREHSRLRAQSSRLQESHESLLRRIEILEAKGAH